jgi:ATP-dependent RNA helicase DeaD
MPKEIARIAHKYMRNSVEIAIGRKNSGAENVQHLYYMVQAKHRYVALKRVVDINPDIYGIVFCRTRQETKEVAEHLMQDGYNADALHGDLSQIQRDSVMQRFRIRNLQLLVATDVAARGLDVNDLTHIINYNLPDDLEVYTHRSGRTGRANKSGVSISIVHVKERGKIKNIERIINKTFERAQVPSGLEVCQSQLFTMINKLQNVNVNEEQIEAYLPMIMKQLEDMEREQLIKNFVSLEFNRFLDYYKYAPDLNVSEKEQSGGKGKSEPRFSTVRLKMNLGQRDGFNPKRVLGLINDTMNDKRIGIGGIEITPRYSFFDVDSNDAKRLVNTFNMQHADSEIILTEVVKGRRKSGSFDRQDKFERGGGGYNRDRNRNRDNDRNRTNDFRPKSQESGKEWRNRRNNESNDKFRNSRDGEYYKKKKKDKKR